MQQYIKNRYKSRKKDTAYWTWNCELCKSKPIIDIHHINSSFRWKREDNPEHLIGLCRECHHLIHSNNTFSTREKLLNKVKEILSIK